MLHIGKMSIIHVEEVSVKNNSVSTPEDLGLSEYCGDDSFSGSGFMSISRISLDFCDECCSFLILQKKKAKDIISKQFEKR